jgi:hypothetical protein
MLNTPDPARAWEYENGFYLTASTTRTGKLLAHYELFKLIVDLPGALIECGVFKGASFTRFAAFRQLLMSPHSKKLIGFDVFGNFPETDFLADVKLRDDFVSAAGTEGISVDQLHAVLQQLDVDTNVELVAGDITETVPTYVQANPELKISLLNLDTDIYEPAVVILKELYPRLVPGGVLLLDDYGVFPGETAAVDEYFQGQQTIRKFPFSNTPCYVIKG